MNIVKKIKDSFFAESPFFLAIPALVWQILFFFIPFAFIISLSFIQNGTFSLAYYVSLYNINYIRIIIRSLLLAFFTAFLCLLFGYPLAYYIGLKQRKWKNVFLAFLILPFWTNLLVHVYAWYFILDKDGIINSLLVHLGIISEPLSLLNNLFAIYLVMFYCYLPFMVLPLFSIIEKIDLSLLEASSDLGATQWQTFYKIVMPLSVSGIKTGFLLVFVPAFGEFVIPLLMGGDKQMYVGTLISYYFLITRSPAQGAAFTILSGLTLLLLIGYFYFGKKGSIKQGQRFEIA